MNKDKLLEFLEEYYKEVFAFEEEMEEEKKAYDQIRSIIEQHFSLTEYERKAALKYINDNLRVNGSW